MKHNFKLTLVLIYSLLLLGLSLFFLWEHNNLYNHVITLSDNQQIMKNSSTSLPIEITITHPYLGTYTFTDEESIQNFWRSLNAITHKTPADDTGITSPMIASTDTESPPPADSRQIPLTGKILYLNGETDNFSLTNQLIFNNQHFYGKYELPIIDNLRNELLRYLYTIPKLTTIIESAYRISIRTSQDQLITENLSARGRQLLIDAVSKAVRLENNQEIQYLVDPQQPAYHLHLHLKNQATPTSSNIIAIDIYKNSFFIVQYMGDKNGRHMYFKSNFDAFFNYLAHRGQAHHE